MFKFLVLFVLIAACSSLENGSTTNEDETNRNSNSDRLR